MPTNVDTAIGSLDPHPSPLSGSEILVFVQSGQTVNGLLSELKTFIIAGIPVATGDLTGTLTAGKYSVASGAKTLVNGRISQTGLNITIPSPDGQSTTIIADNSIEARVLVSGYGSRYYLDDGRAGMQFTTSSTNAYLEAQEFITSIANAHVVILDAPQVRLNQLTANTVPYLGSNKEFISSTITPTELGRLSGIQSNIQTQINTLLSGLSWKQEVVCATTENITLSGTQTIDTIAVVVGNRVLVKNQSTASQNGIYIVASGAWTRATDCDSTAEMITATVQVRLGTASPTGNKDTQWSCSNTNQPVIGTDAITFVQINGGAVYVAGSGLTLTGNSFSVGSGQVVNSMIANNSIDLTEKVTNVLKYINGGTQTATVPIPGATPYATASGYAYDRDNYNYDPITKTLNVNNVYVSSEDGIPGITIEGLGNNLVLKALDAGFDSVIIEALGNGIKVDSASGVAGRFTSSETSGEFNQWGIITADVAYEGLVVNRNFTRADTSTAKASGPLLNVNDATSSTLGTGPLARFVKSNITRFEVGQDGKVLYQKETDIKVSVAGGLGFSVAQTNNNTTSATDIHSYTVKANTLNASGDVLNAEYGFVLSTASHTKQFIVSFNGITLHASSAFSLSGATGSGKITVSIIRVNSAFFEYTVHSVFSDGTALTPVLNQVYSYYINAGIDLTTDQILKVTATCGAGSSTGEIVGNGAKYFLNPQY